MVRLSALALLAVLAACDTAKYRKPITFAPHGAAVRANMAAQIINPAPPSHGSVHQDAARAALAVEAYRAGETEAPSQVRTQDSVEAAASQ